MKGIHFILLGFLMIFIQGFLSPAQAAEDSGCRQIITNVRIFDGRELSRPCSIVIEKGMISAISEENADQDSANVTDARGATLLPGLIDSHIHLEGEKSLREAADWGVTTMLDMGTRSIDEVNRLRNLPGLPDLRSSGNSAAPAGGVHAAMGCVVITDRAQARTYVNERAKEKVDYIKVIADSPKDGEFVIMEEKALRGLTEAAHEKNLKVIAHVTMDASIDLCARCGVDIITHLPIGKPVDAALASKAAQSRMAVIPTLIMMKCILENMPAETRPPMLDYRHAESSLAALKKAGATVMAGTDANTTVCPVPHGKSLHDELELMVQAGFDPVEALRSATVIPALYFGFGDRGVIEPGRRADLLLVEGDPTKDIGTTRNILGVWIKGERIR